ncbi:DUF2484 family protein [Frigidibacter sp. MR17.24]|uniref:DUF2484 family protein n=1 Tax=Frigidibacter sp. MR17.24 TaxID=3127345 RepID=UPI003012BE4C
MALSLVLLMAWVTAVNALPFVPARLRQGAGVALVVCGIAVLGYLTAHCGPVAGIVALCLGAAMLRWPPTAALRPALHRGRRPLEKA